MHYIIIDQSGTDPMVISVDTAREFSRAEKILADACVASAPIWETPEASIDEAEANGFANARPIGLTIFAAKS